MCDTPAFHTALRETHQFLQRSVAVFEALPSVDGGSLVLPSWDLRTGRAAFQQIKQFCVGLLENPTGHPWWPHIQHASTCDRVTISGSLFLARKMLPSIPPSRADHRELLCFTDPIQLPVGYLRHVRRVTRSIFKPGWDRGYSNSAMWFVPPLSSSLGTTRSSGGARSHFVGGRERFLASVLDGQGTDIPRDFNVEYMQVEVDGKTRGVTVADALQHQLGPLHRTMYQTLSSTDWLLRGEAKPSSFDCFPAVDKEVYVSGDYTSATDNLPLEVAEVILDVIQSSSLHIPNSVWALARQSLRAMLKYEDLNIALRQVRGQLMGNLLSFPLLCLQNYCAFSFIVTDTSVPVKINGDDIVFRASREVAGRWMDGVSALGLELSRGKTLVNERFFSLNSTFFRGYKSGRVLRIPVLRPACLRRQVDVPHAIGPSVRSFCRGFTGGAADHAQALYLRWRRGLVTRTGRSVLRDLRAPVTFNALKMSGLLEREAWYLSLAKPLCLPLDRVRLGVSELPGGWVRESRKRKGRAAARAEREGELQFHQELLRMAWSERPVPPKVLGKRVWDETEKTGWESRFREWKMRQRKRISISGRNHRCTRMSTQMRFLARSFKADLSLVSSFSPPARPRKVWVRKPVPRENEGEDVWVDQTPWDQCAYQRFLLK